MPIEIRIRLDASDEARAGKIINHLVERATNRAGLLKNIGEALLQTTKDRFRSETDPDGNKWTPNAPLTLALKKGGSILRARGRLIGSISYNVTGDQLSLGPNTTYAAIQQFGGVVKPKNGKALAVPFKAGAKLGPDGAKVNKGGTIFLKSVTIPARPYIGFGKADQQAVTDIATEWFSLGE